MMSDLTSKHGNKVTSLEQAIKKLKKTMSLDYETCQKTIAEMGEEILTTKSSLEGKLSKCLEEKSDDKYKYKTQIEDLKRAHSELGSSYCERTLQLKEARIDELEIELDICHAGDTDINFDSLKALFDEEKDKFNEILQ